MINAYGEASARPISDLESWLAPCPTSPLERWLAPCPTSPVEQPIPNLPVGCDRCESPPSSPCEAGAIKSILRKPSFLPPVQEMPAQDIADPIKLKVCGLAGALCDVFAESPWTWREVKHAIAIICEVPEMEQRLLLNGKPLLDGELVNVRGSNGVMVTMLRTSRERAKWLELAEIDWMELEDAPREIREDHEVFMVAVQQHGCALRFAAGDLPEDRELVMTAAAGCRNALSYAGVELQRDIELQRISRAAPGCTWWAEFDDQDAERG